MTWHLNGKTGAPWRLCRAVRLVWESGKGLTAASVAVLFVQGTLPLVTLYVMKLVVDGVAASLASPDKHEAFLRVGFWLGVAAALAVAGALCRSAAALIGEAQGQAVTDHVNDLLHAKSIEVDLEYYENSQYYNTLHRAQQDASYRPARVLTGLVLVCQSSLSLLAVAGMIFWLHWGIGTILLVASLPGLVARLRSAGRTYRWQFEQTPNERRAWYFHWLLTGAEHAKEVRAFELGPLFRNQFRDLRAHMRWQRLALVSRRVLAELGTDSGATLAVYGAFAFVAYRTVQGGNTIGDLVLYYMAFQRGQEYLRDLLRGLAGLYEDTLFLSGLYEFLDLKPKVIGPASPDRLPRPMRQGVTFEGVSFQYPGSAKLVLRDIHLAIRPGEQVALVGENGSGKTTLIKLLCRLYDPAEGSIALDGVDLRRFRVADLRREIGVIFQDYAHYQLTARENIWFGNTRLPSDNGRIAAAARCSGADDVIRRLKNGYETMLGKWLGDGEELSIGEWQKVALARAFVRDAQIIVLDEPASALDAQAEYEFFARLRKLAEGRATILISHRFSSVRMADRIYVLDSGRIADHGTHAELLRRGGHYARLFELQAQSYR